MNNGVDGDSNSKKIKILIAEDNEINQKVLKAILDKSPFNYEIVADGTEATQFNSQNNYDLILMDCQMPNKDGFEATRDIRQFESTNNKKRCPIVAITANTMHGDKDKCLAAGMDDFLSKPFKSHQIIDMINKWTVAS